MLNNLSAELNILRPSMLETGLEAISHNLNRKNNDLRFFEFGKTYATSGSGNIQRARTSLFIYYREKIWKRAGKLKPTSDFYVLKGIVAKVLQLLGITVDSFES